MPARMKILFIPVIFFAVFFISIRVSLAEVNLSPTPQTDFMRDVKMGIDQISSNSASLTLQRSIQANEIVEGKISLTDSVEVVEVIQSMDSNSTGNENMILIKPTGPTGY